MSCDFGSNRLYISLSLVAFFWFSSLFRSCVQNNSLSLSFPFASVIAITLNPRFLGLKSFLRFCSGANPALLWCGFAVLVLFPGLVLVGPLLSGKLFGTLVFPVLCLVLVLLFVPGSGLSGLCWSVLFVLVCAWFWYCDVVLCCACLCLGLVCADLVPVLVCCVVPVLTDACWWCACGDFCNTSTSGTGPVTPLVLAVVGFRIYTLILFWLCDFDPVNYYQP